MDASILIRDISTTTFVQRYNVMKSQFSWPMCFLKDTTGKNRYWEAQHIAQSLKKGCTKSIWTGGLVETEFLK